MEAIGVETDKEIVAWGLGLIFTAALGALGIRKKFWRDNNEQSETTSGHIASLWWKEEAELQRKRADRAFDERNKAMEELGALRARVEFLTRTIEQLEMRVAILQQKLDGRGE
jgi:hypothetical protein